MDSTLQWGILSKSPYNCTRLASLYIHVDDLSDKSLVFKIPKKKSVHLWGHKSACGCALADPPEQSVP